MGHSSFHNRNGFAETIDWITVLLLLVLCSFGLFLLLTIGKDLFSQQLAFVLVAVLILFLFSRLDPMLLWWVAPFGYGGAIILLVTTYFFPAIRGSSRWIVIGATQLQPSELVKPILLLLFARLIHRYPPRTLRFLPIHIGAFLVPFLLVFRQPDLGTSLVYASFWLAMMLAGGLPVGSLLLASLGLSALVPWVWSHMAAYQKARITTFLTPGFDPSGAGYNALQSMIAVGSGMLFGRGLGRGTQSHLRFLPEHHTDFIFATLVEELGFFGGLLLLICYAALLWRILSPVLGKNIRELFPFTYSVGLFAMILSQIFINTGMNMGILPITGITLPFVSYGGSSIISIALSFAFLWAVRRFRAVAIEGPNW